PLHPKVPSPPLRRNLLPGRPVSSNGRGCHGRDITRVADMIVLILGGYGTFGGRLARLLSGEAKVALLIPRRSRAKAAAFCAGLPVGTEARPLLFDRDGDVKAQLERAAPDMIVDASGPFQSYGDDPYRVVKAAIALGISYLDLADGAAFVQGIAQFDAAARARNTFALAGASSFPVLTASP